MVFCLSHVGQGRGMSRGWLFTWNPSTKSNQQEAAFLPPTNVNVCNGYAGCYRARIAQGEFLSKLVPGAGIEPTRPFRDPGF